MITELMMLLIAVGMGIVFVAWVNTRRRKQDVLERREVEESTSKLKQELERTANQIIGRMENHVTHLEKVLDESERNRVQMEGRVTELKKLIKKSEGQSGEIRDLLAKLDDASAEVNAMQRKMDNVERKLNLAMTTPIQIQQPVTIPQMNQPLVTPLMNQPVAPITPAPIPPITTPPAPKVTLPPVPPITTPPAPIPPITTPPVPPKITPPVATTITTPPAEPLNPMGPITVSPIPRSTSPEQKIEAETDKNFDKVLEKAISEPVEESARPQPRNSIVLSPETKKPVKIIEADPVKIEATRKKLNEASAKMAANPPEDISIAPTQPPRRKRKKSSRSGRDVREEALEAIRAAEKNQSESEKPPVKEIIPPKEKESLSLHGLKLETTDSSIIKEMLLSGMTIEEISRETGLGRGAIELVQELTRRQLDRK